MPSDDFISKLLAKGRGTTRVEGLGKRALFQALPAGCRFYMAA